MATLNQKTKEAQFKIVYCGAPLSGKTTNVSYIQSHVSGDNKSDLISLATAAERTLFFDFLPMKPVISGGYSCRFHLYTVPGQITFNATLELVLRGADGLVFVADSGRDRAADNQNALRNIDSNLRLTKRSLFSLPVVYQYNKRDGTDIMSVEEMDRTLNPPQRPFPVMEACASQGHHVFETLNLVCGHVLHRFQALQEKQEKASATATASGGGY